MLDEKRIILRALTHLEKESARIRTKLAQQSEVVKENFTTEERDFIGRSILMQAIDEVHTANAEGRQLSNMEMLEQLQAGHLAIEWKPDKFEAKE